MDNAPLSSRIKLILEALQLAGDEPISRTFQGEVVEWSMAPDSKSDVV